MKFGLKTGPCERLRVPLPLAQKLDSESKREPPLFRHRGVPGEQGPLLIHDAVQELKRPPPVPVGHELLKPASP